MLITFLRSEGLHPVDINTSAHFSLAGAEIEFPINVPTGELDAARVLLEGYDNSPALRGSVRARHSKTSPALPVLCT